MPPRVQAAPLMACRECFEALTGRKFMFSVRFDRSWGIVSPTLQ